VAAQRHEAARMQERTGLSRWLAWVFVVFALGDLAYYIATAKFDANPSLTDIGTYALQVIPSVVSVLIPAALLFRHPDAAARASTLLLGSILFALAQVLQILGNPLEPFFEAATPPSLDLPTIVPMAEIYNGFISVVLAVALLSIAAGLTRARRYDDRGGFMSVLFVPLMTVIGTALNVLATATSGIEGLSLTLGLVLFVGSAVVLPVVRIVIWSYLVTSLFRGWRSGESPRVGWGLGTLGSALVVAGLLLFNLNGVIPSQGGNFDTAYAYATVIAYAIGHLSLLAAFLVGLPALDPADEEVEERLEVGEEAYDWD
jgi:hypothetical protein